MNNRETVYDTCKGLCTVSCYIKGNAEVKGGFNMKRAKKILISGSLAMAMLFGGCSKSEPAKKQADVKTLKWAIVGLYGYETNDAVSTESVEKLNEELKASGKDYRIEFECIPLEKGRFSETDEKRFQECDFVTMENQFESDHKEGGKVTFYDNLEWYAKKGAFEPLDEFLETEEGKEIKELFLTEETLKKGTLDGEQLLLPTEPAWMTGSSIRIRQELYEKAGFTEDTVPDFTKCDKLFARLYEANDNRPFLKLSNVKQQGGINGIKNHLPDFIRQFLESSGSLFDAEVLGCGTVVSEKSNRNVKNLLQEPYFEEYMNAWKRYEEKGYVTEKADEEALVEPVNSFKTEIEYLQDEKGIWVTPKSENYVLKIYDLAYGSGSFFGVCADGKQKDLAFEAMVDFFLDKEVNAPLQQFSAEMISSLLFQSGLSEKGEKAYCELSKTAQKFEMITQFNTFDAEEIEPLNEVFAEYCADASENGAEQQNILELYFSENGEVTEESIHKGVETLNEKLEEAGMSRFLETFQENRKVIKTE